MVDALADVNKMFFGDNREERPESLFEFMMACTNNCAKVKDFIQTTVVCCSSAFFLSTDLIVTCYLIYQDTRLAQVYDVSTSEFKVLARDFDDISTMFLMNSITAVKILMELIMVDLQESLDQLLTPKWCVFLNFDICSL